MQGRYRQTRVRERELDALPMDVLRTRIVAEVEKRMRC